MKAVILLADNDPFIQQEWAPKLVEAGYSVIPANSADEALQVVQNRRVHLAVLDIRLMNDDNEYDDSGLRLARSREFLRVPKIMLTNSQLVSDALAALKKTEGSEAIADGYVLKRVGIEGLLEEIERVVAQSVRMNWDLPIRSGDRQAMSVHQLAGLVAIGEGVDGGLTGGEHPEELADLFRKLFYDAEQVTLDRLLWYGSGRVALTVRAYLPDRAELHLVVKCGSPDKIADEGIRFANSAPRPTHIGLEPGAFVSLTRVAAQVYLPSGNSLEGARSFSEFYRERTSTQIGAALRDLFSVTLQPWHANQRLAAADTAPIDLYLKRIGLDGDDIAMTLTERFRQIDLQARQHGIGGFQLVPSGLQVTLPKLAARYYPDPILYLKGEGNFLNDPSVQIGTTIGAINGSTVLVTSETKAWPTDFGDLAEGPILGDYAAMEAAVRFDLLEQSDLASIHDFEVSLAEPDRLNDRLEGETGFEDLTKAKTVIRQIRMLAASACGVDVRQYYLAILLQASKRLLAAESSVRRSRLETARLAQCCISMGVFTRKLIQSEWAENAGEPSANLLEFDSASGRIRVNGQQVPDLTPTEDRCFRFLWEFREKLCGRKDVFEATFAGERYTSDEDGRLTMVIGRLRSKIEPNPEKPVFIIVRRGHGILLQHTDPHK